MTFFAILIIACVSLMLIAGVIFILFIRMLTGGNGGHRAGQAEDTRLIQELHQSLSRMEKRIESLETILLEREKPLEKTHENVK